MPAAPRRPSGRAALSCPGCPRPSRDGFLPRRAPLLAREDAREGRFPLRPRPLLQLLLVLEGDSQLLHDGVERQTLWGEGMALNTSQRGEPGGARPGANLRPHGAQGAPREIQLGINPRVPQVTAHIRAFCLTRLPLTSS